MFVGVFEVIVQLQTVQTARLTPSRFACESHPLNSGTFSHESQNVWGCHVFAFFDLDDLLTSAASSSFDSFP